MSEMTTIVTVAETCIICQRTSPPPVKQPIGLPGCTCVAVLHPDCLARYKTQSTLCPACSECVICCMGPTSSQCLISKANEFEGCQCQKTFFHETCYTQYRQTSANCPTCRRFVWTIIEPPPIQPLSNVQNIQVLLVVLTVLALTAALAVLGLSSLVLIIVWPTNVNALASFIATGAVFYYSWFSAGFGLYWLNLPIYNRYDYYFAKSIFSTMMHILGLAVSITACVSRFGFTPYANICDRILVNLLVGKFFAEVGLFICLFCRNNRR